MFSFFHGSDKEKARKKSREVISAFQKKNPLSPVTRYTSENFNQSEFEEYINSRSLFGNANIIFLDNVLENENFEKNILDKREDIKKSANFFIILEGKLNKSISSKIAKSADVSEEFSSVEKSFGKDNSIFALADSLGKRDKKNFWILIRKTLDGGIPAEEIHGILFWQVKSMILASKSKTAKEAGLKDFVYNKSKSYSKNFKENELIALSSRLVSMYHDAHLGIHEFETELEKFALTI